MCVVTVTPTVEAPTEQHIVMLHQGGDVLQLGTGMQQLQLSWWQVGEGVRGVCFVTQFLQFVCSSLAILYVSIKAQNIRNAFDGEKVTSECEQPMLKCCECTTLTLCAVRGRWVSPCPKCGVSSYTPSQLQGCFSALTATSQQQNGACPCALLCSGVVNGLLCFLAVTSHLV